MLGNKHDKFLVFVETLINLWGMALLSGQFTKYGTFRAIKVTVAYCRGWKTKQLLLLYYYNNWPGFNFIALWSYRLSFWIGRVVNNNFGKCYKAIKSFINIRDCCLDKFIVYSVWFITVDFATKHLQVRRNFHFIRQSDAWLLGGWKTNLRESFCQATALLKFCFDSSLIWYTSQKVICGICPTIKSF